MCIRDRVLAAADGTVSDIYADDLLGTTVVISHGGGIESVYSNLAELPTVAPPTLIIEVGSVTATSCTVQLPSKGSTKNMNRTFE